MFQIGGLVVRQGCFDCAVRIALLFALLRSAGQGEVN